MTAEELLERYAAGERDFSGVDLNGLDLSGTELRCIILRGADLRGASFQDSDLSGYWKKPSLIIHSDFRETNCCGADFSGATIEILDFSNAILTGASFSGAVLDKVKFIDANLVDVDWFECQIWRATMESAITDDGLDDIIWTDWTKGR
ncbi:MAG: pentapeptide repeat-containing protein [Aphanocapsa sp. GSE-SYN-MK-11-07L]|jgi:uncharacterized protein YjbI with pentapeptide repeats|nr:pentapeptide repeat-containing protein [Aphanocapsa sp. GSE-SYN-MK-11-07L]